MQQKVATCKKSSGLKIRSARQFGILGGAVSACQTFLDLAINAFAGEVCGNTNRIFERIRVGRSMADNGHTLDAQQWGSAVFAVVQALLEVHKRTTRKQHAELASHRRVQRFLQ